MLGRLLTLVCVGCFSAGDARAEDVLDIQIRALRAITESAASICNVVKTEGSSQSVEVSGDVKAELAGVVKKLADLGISGAGRYASEKHDLTVLQQDLSNTIKSNSDCRKGVLELLKDKMIPDQPKSGRLLPSVNDTGFDLVNSVIKKTFTFGLGELHVGVNGVKGQWAHFACDCLTGDFWHYKYSWSRNRRVILAFMANSSNMIEGIRISDTDPDDVRVNSLLILYRSLRRQWGDPNKVDVKYYDGFSRDQLQLFQGVRYHYQHDENGEAILIAIDH
jgi:hypothetical protein